MNDTSPTAPLTILPKSGIKLVIVLIGFNIVAMPITMINVPTNLNAHFKILFSFLIMLIISIPE